MRSVDAPARERARAPAWRIAAVFIVVYAALQGGWIAARGTALESFLIEDVNVRTAVALIQLLSPQIPTVAKGASIVAPGGGLNVRNGCEGTEILFPLLAALLACPMSWRTRVFAMLIGSVVVFALNQARLLALFYAFRDSPQWFAQLHGFITPLCLMLCVVAFFAGVLQWEARGRS